MRGAVDAVRTIMPHIFTVKDAMPADAGKMAPNLRDADRQELAASLGCDIDAEKVLCNGIALSERAETLLVDNEPIAMYGVIPLTAAGLRIGAIWLLGTEGIEDVSTFFLRNSKKNLELQGSEFDILTNVVDARNTVHIKWLKWLGFTFVSEEKGWGAEGRTFYKFVRIMKCVHL